MVTKFEERVRHSAEVGQLLGPFGLEVSVGDSILDTKMPSYVHGRYVLGVTVSDVVVCEVSDFLIRNPLIALHISETRQKNIDVFHAEQKAAYEWHKRPTVKE